MIEGQWHVVDGHHFTVYQGHGIELIQHRDRTFVDNGQVAWKVRIQPPWASPYGILGKHDTMALALSAAQAYIQTQTQVKPA